MFIMCMNLTNLSTPEQRSKGILVLSALDCCSRLQLTWQTNVYVRSFLIKLDAHVCYGCTQYISQNEPDGTHVFVDKAFIKFPTYF